MSIVQSLYPHGRATPAPSGAFGAVIDFPARGPARKLRILHIDFSFHIGGSQRYLLDLAHQQVQLGHEVHVAAPAGSALEGALAPGIAYHAVRSPLFRSLQLGRIIDRVGIDVCHAHLGRASKALSRVRTGARKVATLHVGYKAHQHGGLDGVICVNQAQTWRLDGYEGQARVISNWMPTVTEPQAPVDLRAQLNLPANTMMVGAVGRLHASKGCDVLVAAFRDVAPADAALVLLGEGPQRQELEKMCEGDPRIHFLGFRDDVAAVIDNFDLFVSPSREESFGLAILEAMGAGLPVIATDTDGPGDYLRSQPATLVEPGSVGALSQALARHIYRPSPAPHYDLRPFDPLANVSRIVDFYAHLGAGEGGLAQPVVISQRHAAAAEN